MTNPSHLGSDRRESPDGPCVTYRVWRSDFVSDPHGMCWRHAAHRRGLLIMHCVWTEAAAWRHWLEWNRGSESYLMRLQLRFARKGPETGKPLVDLVLIKPDKRELERVPAASLDSRVASPTTTRDVARTFPLRKANA